MVSMQYPLDKMPRAVLDLESISSDVPNFMTRIKFEVERIVCTKDHSDIEIKGRIHPNDFISYVKRPVETPPEKLPTDYQRVMRTVYEEPWASMRLIADMLTDEDKPVLARGMGQLAIYYKLPDLSAKGFYWWINARDSNHGNCYGMCCLPVEVFNHNKVSNGDKLMTFGPRRDQSANEPRHYMSKEDALLAAAEAWGEALNKGLLPE
jgi:hypothetical protein